MFMKESLELIKKLQDAKGAKEKHRILVENKDDEAFTKLLYHGARVRAMSEYENIDVVEFCEDNLGIKLFPYQRMLLKQMEKQQSVFVRWPSRYLYYGSLLTSAEYMK